MGWLKPSLKYLNYFVTSVVVHDYSSVKNTHDFYSQKKELTSKPVLCNESVSKTK